jgi:hypothetical protein
MVELREPTVVVAETPGRRAAPRTRSVGVPCLSPMPHRGKDSQPLATDEGRSARVREVSADVALRLACVCAELSPDDFAALVRRIAEVTVKYEALAELRSARVGAPPESRGG